MKKVTFCFSGGCIGSKVTEIVEFPDNMTDKEIDDELTKWLYERSNAFWKEEVQN
jgi:hypothetical protein